MKWPCNQRSRADAVPASFMLSNGKQMLVRSSMSLQIHQSSGSFTLREASIVNLQLLGYGLSLSLLGYKNRLLCKHHDSPEACACCYALLICWGWGNSFPQWTNAHQNSRGRWWDIKIWTMNKRFKSETFQSFIKLSYWQTWLEMYFKLKLLSADKFEKLNS